MGAENAAEVERLRAAFASLVLTADTLFRYLPPHSRASAQEDAEAIADVMIAAGVWLPPADAELSEGRMVSIAASARNPWAGIEIENRDGRVIDWATGVDITERYHEWLAEQPAVNTRTYEWPEPPPICPECRDGKHRNCGPALNVALDVIVPCRCDHGEAS